MKLKPLPQQFFSRPSVEVAQALLGNFLVRETGTRKLVGRIVETEAYHESEAACHAYRGRTPANELLFSEGGHAYIYLIYGIHWMLNVSTGKEACGEGVLLRAVEVLEGFDDSDIKTGSGPAKLTKAFEVNKSLAGTELFRPGELWIAQGDLAPDEKVVVAPRIGVEYAGEDAKLLWRFFIGSSLAVSKKPKPLTKDNI